MSIRPIRGIDDFRFRSGQGLTLALILAVATVTIFTGCDRLRRVTVENQNSWIQESACGRIGLSAEQFVDLNFYLYVKNLSPDTLLFHPMRLKARLDGKILAYRLERSGKYFDAESLFLAPGDKFNYDIQSRSSTVQVRADSLFSAHGNHCGLDTLTLRVNE